MEYLLLAGLGAIILIAIYSWFSRQKTGAESKAFTGNVESSGHVHHAAAQAMTNAARVAVPTQNDLENEVRAMLATGNKIVAVKLVRERTSLGLKEAKDLVDSIESGAPASAPPPLADTTFGNARGDSGDVDAEVRVLLAYDRKIEAIKLVRERTGLGLKEAKDYVERL